RLMKRTSGRTRSSTPMMPKPTLFGFLYLDYNTNKQLKFDNNYKKNIIKQYTFNIKNMDKKLIENSLLIPENLKKLLLGSATIPQEVEHLLEKFFGKYGHYDEKINNIINESGSNILVEYVNEKEAESLKQDIIELQEITSKLDNL
ncbi:MAG: hypothetical protein V3575_05225, partial [Candidatus Absconditabacteria bacterium]